MRVFAGAVALALVLAGCATGTREQTWTAIPLPDDFAASQLLVVDGRLVVGGNVGEQPALLVAGGDSIPVTATSFYGDLALWTTLVADGDVIRGLGGKTGGGHGNPRWSTWAGGLDGLTEEPEQGREVFGGWRGGGLAGMAILDGVPVIVGGRTGANPGLDIAIWLQVGEDWVEQPVAPALAATAGELPFPTSVVTVGDELLITGYLQRLGGGTVTNVPTIWVGRPGGEWVRTELPVDAPVAAADAASCVEGECVVTGHVDGMLAAWRSADGEATRLELPGLATDDAPAPVRWDGTWVLAGGGGLVTAEGARIAAPDGIPIALAADGDELWVLTTDGLWSAA